MVQVCSGLNHLTHSSFATAPEVCWYCDCKNHTDMTNGGAAAPLLQLYELISDLFSSTFHENFHRDVT